MSEFNCDWLADPRCILDIGTYDGSDAAMFKERFPSCRVLAVEACPDNYSIMMSRFFPTLFHVEVFHFAACDFDGEVPFFSNTDTHFPGHFGQSGSLLTPTDRIDRKWRGGRGEIQFKQPRMVTARRLDTFCAGQNVTWVDLLHMDVQGAESLVIDGMGDMRPRMIFLETDETKETSGYVGAVPFDELVERLTSRGYALKWQSPHDALYVLA